MSCGVDVLLRITKVSMAAIRDPMMKGFRCVSNSVTFALCKCVFC